MAAKVRQIERRVPRARSVPWELKTPMWRHSWIDAGGGEPDAAPTGRYRSPNPVATEQLSWAIARQLSSCLE
jgi:hypothetical protein